MKKQRLDKFIADTLNLSRKQARIAIYKGQVKVDSKVVINIDTLLMGKENIFFEDKLLQALPKFEYYILHKPKGYICAESDKRHKTVMDILPDRFKKAEIMPVGRLDIDTTGLLFFTNNGILAHRLLSPKWDVLKKYLALLNREINANDKQQFQNGLDLGNFISKPAVLQNSDLSPYHAVVLLSEGKFHQVKRMFAKVGAEVLELHRSAFSVLELDIALGEYRPLRKEEISALHSICHLEEES